MSQNQITTIQAISAPIAMQSQLADFLNFVNSAKVSDNIPDYCKNGEKEFTYIVAFKQVYKVKKTEYEGQTAKNRMFTKQYKRIEKAIPSKASEDSEAMMPVKSDDGKTIETEVKEDGKTVKKEVFELVTEFAFVGWKELKVLKSETYLDTQKTFVIAFKAREGLTAKAIMLYAIDVLAKKNELATINGSSLVRKSSQIHAFMPTDKDRLNTMTTGGGVPARFLSDDLSKFIDLFMKKVERSQAKNNELLPAISAKVKELK